MSHRLSCWGCRPGSRAPLSLGPWPVFQSLLSLLPPSLTLLCPPYKDPVMTPPHQAIQDHHPMPSPLCHVK